MSAANALQAAIHARLSADAALSGVIGPGGMVDRLIEPASNPTVRLAEIDSRDWSTASEPGEEHAIRIEIRSGEGGHRMVQAVAALVRALLHDAALTVAGHHLVNLRHEGTRTLREAAARGHLAEMRFRAVTEPNAG